MKRYGSCPDPWSGRGAYCTTGQFAQAGNRRFLRDVMTGHGFRPLDSEWWHFQLIDEPFPETWFDFVIR